MENSLILGDNLQILKEMPDESVDLCYIDPPFFSNRNYEVIWGDSGEVASFTDRWAGGIDHYIGWLQERVEEIYRVLKPTGSIYLHCDWHANAEIKVYILNKIFGRNNFRNEIIWQYYMGGKPNTYFSNKHDTIFWYSKSDKWTFNELRIKRYLDFVPSLKDESKDAEGGKDNIGYYSVIKCPDVWSIKGVFNLSNEYIGYPTQKPEALLERIIKASSNEGDVVLDCFCGGGTTMAVAMKLKRKFIGIDQSVQAVAVTKGRLERDMDLFNQIPFVVKLYKYDYDTIRYSEAFEFERFIIEKFDGEPNIKQRNDFGIDGFKKEKKAKIPIQVKRSENIGRNVIDNFKSALERFDKKLKTGYIIAFSFGKGAVEEVARLKREENIDIQLIRVEEIIEIAKKPDIKLNYTWKEVAGSHDKEITFTAEGIKKMEMFQWDFNYDLKTGFNAEVLIDKQGKQTQIFKSGKYKIAVKGIALDGLENVESLELIINGGVKES